MDLLTGICFEVTPECNLRGEHDWCPSNSPERFTVSGPSLHRKATVCDLASRFWHEFGFRGAFCYHFYNEPLFVAEHLFGIVDELRERLNGSRHILWTNGTLVADWMAPHLAHFTDIVVTNYGNLDINHVLKVAPKARIMSPILDDRLSSKQELAGDSCWPGCVRPFTELGIDYFGGVHLCCYDWRGASDLGNVFRDDLRTIVAKWQAMRDVVVSAERADEVPACCRRCGHAFSVVQSHLPGFGMKIVAYTDALEHVYGGADHE